MTRHALVPRMERHATSIFGEMSALATQVGAINLGQGFPDTDGPEEVKRVAMAAIEAGLGNQYPPVHGLPDLRLAIAEHQKRFYGLEIDPQTQVVVTTGASEAIQSALLSLVDQGDEVIVFEPWFDISTGSASTSRMAGECRCPCGRRRFAPTSTPSATRSPTAPG